VAIKCEVLLDSGFGDTLGDDRPLVLKTPEQQALLHRQVLLLGEVKKGLVLVERWVGGAKAWVAGAVNALLLAVLDELGRGVVGVELDLVWS
jgi:hypothetical protein